jgi:transglutaminase-like putative cysteine protease
LQEPIRVTKALFYLDGGSIGLEIVDGRGATTSFALPISSVSGADRYTHFALGTVRAAKTNSQQLIPLDSKTRAYIAYLLERKTPRDTDADIALTSLRGAPRDYATALIHVLQKRLLKE